MLFFSSKVLTYIHSYSNIHAHTLIPWELSHWWLVPRSNWLKVANFHDTVSDQISWPRYFQGKSIAWRWNFLGNMNVAIFSSGWISCNTVSVVFSKQTHKWLATLRLISEVPKCLNIKIQTYRMEHVALSALLETRSEPKSEIAGSKSKRVGPAVRVTIDM